MTLERLSPGRDVAEPGADEVQVADPVAGQGREGVLLHEVPDTLVRPGDAIADVQAVADQVDGGPDELVLLATVEPTRDLGARIDWPD